MGLGGWIAALGIGGAAAFVLSKRSAAATPTSPTGTGAFDCDKLASIDPLAAAACKGVKGIAGIFGGLASLVDPQFAKKDAENKKLNGTVDVPLSAGVQSCNAPLLCLGPECKKYYPNQGFEGHAWGTWGNSGPQGTRYQQLQGTVLRFKNGCVPFRGTPENPGWKKCAPGTHDMSGGSGARYFTNDNQLNAQSSMVMTGQILRTQWDGRAFGAEQGFMSRSAGYRHVNGDPSSGYFNRIAWMERDDIDAGKPGPCAKSFPIPVPAGHVPFWYRGAAFTCPPDANGPTEPDFSKYTDPSAPTTTPPRCVGRTPRGTVNDPIHPFPPSVDDTGTTTTPHTTPKTNPFGL